MFFEIHAPKENNWIFCVYMFRFEPIFPNSIQLESESSLEHHEELLKSKFNPTFSVLQILQFFFIPLNVRFYTLPNTTLSDTTLPAAAARIITTQLKTVHSNLCCIEALTLKFSPCHLHKSSTLSIWYLLTQN